MQDYQREFIEFALELGVLRFGEFKLKSGRMSPYFFNAGLFDDGRSLARLGRAYAAAIAEAGVDFDLLFGPAYKGIPLAAITAAALSDHHNRNVAYAFNRKEAKDHGEGGNLVGAPLEGKIMIIDDVISAGTSVREAVDIIRANGASPAGVIIALDRQERGKDERSAIQEVEQDYGMKVINIICLADLIAYLEEVPGNEEHLARIREYNAEWGCA